MTLLRPGVSIVDRISNSLPGIASRFESNMESLHGATPAIREHLMEIGKIVPIPPTPATLLQKSLATVDGGVVNNQMQIGDICISGAAVGEGAQFRFLYGEETDTPTLADARILDHKSGNDSLVSAFMATQETALLDMIPHDIRIRDGAWLNSITTIYLLLLGKNERVTYEYCMFIADIVANNTIEGNEIARGVDRLIAPWRYDTSGVDVLALTKSDSSNALVHSLLSDERDTEMYNILARKRDLATVEKDEPRPYVSMFEEVYSDRVLSTQVLRPGEMFKPTPLATGHGARVASELSRTPGLHGAPDALIKRSLRRMRNRRTHDRATLDHVEHILIDSLINTGYEGEQLRDQNQTPLECLRTLGDLSVPEEAWLWSTYLKPTEFLADQRTLRFEFARPLVAKSDQVYTAAVEKSSYLAQIVNAEVVTSDIQEAFSQYMADRRAKEVSQASKLIQQYIAANTDNEAIALGFSRSYRT